jgi:hypothetical protein
MTVGDPGAGSILSKTGPATTAPATHVKHTPPAMSRLQASQAFLFILIGAVVATNLLGVTWPYLYVIQSIARAVDNVALPRRVSAAGAVHRMQLPLMKKDSRSTRVHYSPPEQARRRVRAPGVPEARSLAQSSRSGRFPATFLRLPGERYPSPARRRGRSHLRQPLRCKVSS